MEENNNKSNKTVQSLVMTGKTITGSFTNMKLVTIVSVVCACLVAFGCVGYTMYAMNQSRRQVFVIDNGQVLTASSQDAAISIRDRIEFQSRYFHKLLFTITPNREVMTRNVEDALKISDRTVYNYYQDLNEKRHYARMYQNAASQDIVVDSVRIDISRKPYRVATFSTLTITRASNMSKSILVTHCNMREVNMNAKNMQGLQIENFEVLRNDEIRR